MVDLGNYFGEWNDGSLLADLATEYVVVGVGDRDNLIFFINPRHEFFHWKMRSAAQAQSRSKITTSDLFIKNSFKFIDTIRVK